MSRGLKEQAAELRQKREILRYRLGRDPTVSELAAAAGLEPEEVAAAETAVCTVTSLQEEIGEDGLALESILGYDGIEEDLIERLTVQ